MTLEDQLRQAVNGLDADLPAGFAQRAKRGAVRRQHRRQALVAGTGVVAVAAAGTAFTQLHGSASHRVTVGGSPLVPEVTYDVDGVRFSLPDGYSGVARGPVAYGDLAHNDAGQSASVATFGQGGTQDGLLTVRVLRGLTLNRGLCCSPASAVGPTVPGRDPDKTEVPSQGTLVQVWGPDAAVAAFAGSVSDSGQTPSSFTELDGVLVPIPDGYRVVRRTGPDTPASAPPAGAVRSRSSLLLAADGVTDLQAHDQAEGSIEVIVLTFDQVPGLHDDDAHPAAPLSYVRRLSDTRQIQVNGYGVDQDVVLALTSGARLG